MREGDPPRPLLASLCDLERSKNGTHFLHPHYYTAKFQKSFKNGPVFSSFFTFVNLEFHRFWPVFWRFLSLPETEKYRFEVISGGHFRALQEPPFLAIFDPPKSTPNLALCAHLYSFRRWPNLETPLVLGLKPKNPSDRKFREMAKFADLWFLAESKT